MPHPVVETQTVAGVKARVLPAREWDRLLDYGPFKAAGGVLPNREHAFVVVLENEAGEIIGCWMARDMVLLEGLFISEEYRKRYSSAHLLFALMIDTLVKGNITQVMTLIQDPYIEGLAKTAKFEKLAGAVHVLTLGRGI